MQIVATLVGLGNIGNEYINTRHNIGFSVIDFFLQDIETKGEYSLQSNSIKKVNGVVWKLVSPYGTVLICKPSTYMNASGECVAPLLSYYSLCASSLLVIHDELDIPFGTYRIKHGGGDAGHNGLRSISSQLGTHNYTRLRIGIGRPENQEYKIVNWVLGHFTKEEQEKIKIIKPHILNSIYAFIQGGFEKAKYEINRRK